MAEIRPITENFVQYLRDNTAYTIVSEIARAKDRDVVIVRETPGFSGGEYHTNEQVRGIQIEIRAETQPECEKRAWEIFNIILKREFNFVLPAAFKPGSEARFIHHCAANQQPTCLGIVNDYYVYTFNLTVRYFQ